MSGPSRPRRPPGGPLSRPLVLGAALRLIDERGVDALSMRTLGASLGVEAMSLYKHVPSKAALLDGVVELMLEELKGPLPGGPWQDVLRDLAHRYRGIALRHPRAFVLFAQRPVRGYTAARENAAALLAALREGGFGADEAIDAVRTVVRFVIGFALTAPAVPAGSGPELASAELAGEGFPLVADLVGRLGGTDEALFSFGLDVMVAGLSARRG